MGGYSRANDNPGCCHPCHVWGVGISHEGVNILIPRGDELPKVVNKSVYIEPHIIHVDLDKILEKLIEDSLIIHFTMCLH